MTGWIDSRLETVTTAWLTCKYVDTMNLNKYLLFSTQLVQICPTCYYASMQNVQGEEGLLSGLASAWQCNAALPRLNPLGSICGTPSSIVPLMRPGVAGRRLCFTKTVEFCLQSSLVYSPSSPATRLPW